MILQLHDFHQTVVRGNTAVDKALFRQDILEGVVELVAVAVTLVHKVRTVGFRSPGVGSDLAGVGAKAHGAALVACLVAALHVLGVHVVPFGHEIDDLVCAVLVEFLAVGVLKACHVAGELNDCALHAKADAKEGNLVLSRIADGIHLAFHAAVAEAAGHKNAVHACKQGGCRFLVDLLAVHVAQVHCHAVGNATVHEGLVQALVGLLQIHVLAHNGNGHLALGVGKVVDHLPPGLEMGVPGRQAHHDGHLLVKALLEEGQGQFVDVANVNGTEDSVRIHVAEECDLLAQILGHDLLAAAEYDVRLDADGEKLLYTVLGGFGLELPCCAQIGHKCQMDVEAIVPAKIGAQLAYGLKEGQTLDVAHSAADLDDGNVRRVLTLAKGQHKALDLVRDVGDDLHCAAEIVAPALLGDDVVVDGARGGVVLVGQGNVKIALVVTKIEVGFCAVVGHEDLAVLEGVHGARVHIDIWIQLLDGDRNVAGLEQGPEGSRSKPLAQ